MEKDTSLSRAFLCVQAAIDKKAEGIKILDLTSLSSYTDIVIICHGTSDRHVSTIADSILKVASVHHFEIVSKEGIGEGRWALIDLGDVVVHVFLDALRDYYDLENLWSDAKKVKIPAEFYSPSATHVN